jgi:hypothetical protein
VEVHFCTQKNMAFAKIKENHSFCILHVYFYVFCI